MDIPNSLYNEVISRVHNLYFDNIALLNLNTKRIFLIHVTKNTFIPCMLMNNSECDYDIIKMVNALFTEDQEKAINEMSIESIVKALESVKLYKKIYRVKNLPEEQIYKEISCSYLNTEKQYILFTCSDVSMEKLEETENNKRLNDAYKAAEKANNIKSEFLSRMSHDIRTPLNGIIGITDIAMENSDRPDKVQHCLERIQFASQYLLSIVSDILDMSKIESGKTEVVAEPFFMNELVKGAMDVLEADANTKRIDFTYKIQDDIYFEFLGDSLHIKQILINLLSNAIKYTDPEGRVSIQVYSKESHPDDNGLQNISFNITDNGIGMSKEFQKHMFEPFEQAYNDTGTYQNGAGLGLSIVQKLLVLMNGTIEVESSLGKGSTFIVTIPLVKTDIIQTEVLEKQTITQKMMFNGQRILVAEDNEINMEIIQNMLSAVNLRYDSAWNGQECVDLFRKSAIGYYSLVLMDIRMPIMDGREATRRIRRLPRQDTKTPIIALSADAFAEEVKASQSVGMDDYIIKPVSKSTLVTVLRKYIEA